MKQFASATIGAILAGLILFAAQNWWTSAKSGERQRVRVERVAELALKKDQLAAMAAKANEYQDVTITIFSIQNIGSADIGDKSFSSPTPFVWGFGSITDPNSNPKNVTFSQDDKVFSVRYRLLPVGQAHSFWLATGSLRTREFTNDTSGIQVVRAEDDYATFPWRWVAVAAGLVVAFLVGIAAGFAQAVQELAKRGLDFKTLIAPARVATDTETQA